MLISCIYINVSLSVTLLKFYLLYVFFVFFFFFFQAEDGIRDLTVTGVQTCALPIYPPTLRLELRVGVAHEPDHPVHGPPEEGLGEPEQAAVPHGPAHDAPEHVAKIGRASCRERV